MGQRHDKDELAPRVTPDVAPARGDGEDAAAAARAEECTREALLDALREAHEYQAATSEVLAVMSRSPADAQPVFEAIVDSAARLTGSLYANIQLYDGEVVHPAATRNISSGARRSAAYLDGRPARSSLIGRAILDGDVVHVRDVLADPDYSREYAQRGGWRAAAALPILRDGRPLGAIAVGKAEAEFYSDSQIRLLRTFADQAGIAIENVRLFDEAQSRNRELSSALERQKATSEILGVISSTPTDAQPVFEAIARNALRLCGALFANVFLYRDGLIHYATSHNVEEQHREILTSHYPLKPDRTQVSGRVMLTGEVVTLEDAWEDPEYDHRFARSIGWHRALGVPMLRQGTPIGVIVVGWREAGPISAEQEELLRSFADQAVIAIENARLLNELRESLRQQTATADVLKVISRSAFDLQTMLDTLAESAARLCDGENAWIFRRQGAVYRYAASFGFAKEPHERVRAFLETRDVVPGVETVIGRTALAREPVQVADVLAEPTYGWSALQRIAGYRTALGVPLMRNGEPVGILAMTRNAVRPFGAKQIELATTFANQAVIAIENVTLFERAEARTRELDAALQQQIATSEVLKVISRSAFDLQSVLGTLVEAATRLCQSDKGTIARERQGQFRRVASHGFSAEFDSLIDIMPMSQDQGSAAGRAVRESRIVHIEDVEADPEYTFSEGMKLGGYRAILAVPMLKADRAIGVLVLTRSRPEAFSEKEIELASTFADQAAIAIENVRLFESAEARSRELARSLEELRTAQDRLVQTEKLASLGQLTSGIAHEIKNPLNFVNNFSSVSTDLLDELTEAIATLGLSGRTAEEVDELAGLLRGNLEKIVQHGRRADSIVKNMLLHARHGSGDEQPTDINALVEGALALAYHGARAERPGFDITLERDFDPAAGEAVLYPQEITRVLLNLITNGFYAAGKRADLEGSGYAPTLRAATRDLGAFVEISIRDNGTGIPAAIRDQLFAPFFTTKPAGEGTGLGLSISHDIVVKQHGGTIEVLSEEGVSTEFRVVLPRDRGRTAEAEPRSPAR
ncbi:GAF domain-containing protein [Acuticoccus sediminis]|nr:GAF domain-containing protein [Acuticoccus sediminis]